MDIQYNADVIVIGAGPAGIAAAYTIAQGGKKVVLLERAQYPGSKNMYGGAVYTTALKEVFQEDFNKIPYERIINTHSWSFLNEQGSFDMTYNALNTASAYAIKRFDLEKWMIETVTQKGVYFAPNTLVEELIVKDGFVVGVKYGNDEYYAPITILADGVNSLLAKKAGLREEYDAKDMFLSVKETIKLDKKTIEDRFNLKSDGSNGVCKQFFGTNFGALKGIKNLFSMGYFYTFKDTVMLGVGVDLADLSKNKLNPNDVLDEIKKHPIISQLIEGGQTIEYSAHLIPEFGYKKMPKLVSDGVMVIGDAAGFVNGVHFEGTNFALISGKIAGGAALLALLNQDYSQTMLNVYKQKLSQTFILKDLYSYRNIIKRLHSRSNSLGIYYPNKIREFFEIFTGANCVSKSVQFRKFVFGFIKNRSILEPFKDCFAFLKCALDVFFGR